MSEVDLNADPKNVLVNTIKSVHTQIQFMFMNQTNSTRRLIAMKALIDGLDAKSQHNLSRTRKNISYYLQTAQYTDAHLDKCFQEISIYLDKTYFREITKGIVSTATLPTETKLKKRKKIPIRLDAGI